MNLVEAEQVGPVEGDAPLVTPPRPPHRRVSVSLLFTLTVLIGTVVAIYATFPARHDVLLTEAMNQHRASNHVWDLVSPSPAELRAYVIGFAGKEIVLPAQTTAIQGAKRIELLDRAAAVIGLSIGEDRVTYLCQRARGIMAKTSHRREDEGLVAQSWKRGAFTCVAVGDAATEARWIAPFKALAR